MDAAALILGIFSGLVPIDAPAEPREVPMAAVEVPAKAMRAPTSVVIGKLEPSSLWLPDGDVSFEKADSGAAKAPSSPTPPPAQSPPPALRDPTPVQSPAARGAAAVFELGPAEMTACASSRRFRDAAFLAATLLEDVDRIVVLAGPGAAACAKQLATRLAADGHRVDVADAEAEVSGVRVRLELRETTAAPRDVKPVPRPEAPPQVVPSPPKPDDKLVLLIDGEVAFVQDDGWFAFVAERSVPVNVVLSKGGRVLARAKTMPLLLREGPNPAYANPRFDGVELAAASVARPRVTFRPSQRLASEASIALSLPLVVKLGIGYTALLPVPDEAARDRPTIEGSIRTHPVFEDVFLSASATVSSKSASKVPLAFVGLVTASRDLAFIRDNLSVPVGLGLRVFRATLKTEDEARDGSFNPASVTIPRSVLGPAAQAGVRYRTGLLQIDANLAVAPIKVAGSPLITTVDGALTIGYQVSPEDTVVFGSRRHDVRYPTSGDPAKVVAASITLGYERDLY